MLDVLVDFCFVIYVFGFCRSTIFLLCNCSDYLLQFIQFLLEGLNIFLIDLDFELIRKLLWLVLKPQFI